MEILKMKSLCLKIGQDALKVSGLVSYYKDLGMKWQLNLYALKSLFIFWQMGKRTNGMKACSITFEMNIAPNCNFISKLTIPSTFGLR